jgi:hypothetical protein
MSQSQAILMIIRSIRSRSTAKTTGVAPLVGFMSIYGLAASFRCQRPATTFH